MPSIKTDIDAVLVETAIAEARCGVDGIKDYVDRAQPYLVLRLRRHAITWLVKTRASTRSIGSPPDVGVRRARRLAEDELARQRKVPPPLAADADAPPGWTWSDLLTQYIEYLSNPRIVNDRAREPSKNTIDDARLSLGRPAFDDWSDRQIRVLAPADLARAIRSIQSDVSHRQARKAYAYTKAALTWALSTHTDESGLSATSPWWMAMRVPSAPQVEVERKLAKQRAAAVAPLTVEHLGRFLAAHEAYCSGRKGRHRVSPAVRWGLWWACLTVVRRGAAMTLVKDAIIWKDERGDDGWGLAWWPADVMKARLDHWLPIPPVGLHILRRVQRDWQTAVEKKHGASAETRWVFASTRRIGRRDDTRDVVVAPDAISNHLSRLRGLRGVGHRDHLKDIPFFSLHDLRDVAASYLLDIPDLPPGAASTMLAHTIQGDVDPRHERLSATTRQFYDFAQRIPLKREAMRAWSEALLASYRAAGGIYPE